jgi:KipI family sensor histidine kinase inhibitor
VTPTVQPLGDAAFVVTFARELSETANACAIALAASLEVRRPEGVLDIVPAMASLTVHVAPGQSADVFLSDLRRRAEAAVRDARAAEAPATHEIPVVYGGESGPDLDDVAAFAGCTPEDVVARHVSRVYRVYMLGFLPGFAYLGDVDPSIAAPRRAAPRQAVPAGSVGIAGAQTGVYPQASPGGWQIIGRTPLRMFDPASGSRLRPGDRVRFVATTSA